MNGRDALPALILALLIGAAACGGGGSNGPAGLPEEWPTFGRTLERTGFNPHETRLTKDTAGRLVPKWQFATEGPVAASPVVATVDLPDDGPTRLVVVGSYDGNVYAIRAADGEEVWRFTVKPHPGVSFGAIAATASIDEVDGRETVYIAGGETMYALDAGTGELIWEFDAGTGCTDCDPETERNEILSSPAVLPEEDLVLFGMDINQNAPGKGGFYAISAKDGHLRWYFDVDTGATCHAGERDNVRRFDGFHEAHDLGLGDHFFGSREGCDFDRTGTACGNVWSPVTVDTARQLIYISTSNCNTDKDPDTPEQPPPMPTYNEALVALDYDGIPVWTWRPREVDNDDLAFGAAPNLFVAEIDGEEREVVGLGGKDGTYYVLDRDGVNARTGEIEPYWQTNVVAGGSIGGMTGTPAAGDGMVLIGTAIGEEDDFQSPSAWGLSMDDGEVVWSQPAAVPFFGATSAVPGIAFMGGIDTQLRLFDTTTGDVLHQVPLLWLGFSQAAIVDGEVFVGAGFGARAAGGSGEALRQAELPAAVWAFCIQGEDDCEEMEIP